MHLKRIFLISISVLLLFGCVADNNKTAQVTDPGYEIRLKGEPLDNATVFDSNQQQAVYKGNGVYWFARKPQGTITLKGGRFAQSHADNTMTMKIDANTHELSPLNTFFYAYPHLQDKLLTALKGQNQATSQAALTNTSNIIYIMASHHLLDEFSQSLKDANSYNDVFRSAQSAALLSSNATIIDSYLLAMLTLSFFDIDDAAQVEKINTTANDANKRYISEQGAGLKNGSSWDNAYSGTQLQQAIDEMAPVKGTLWIAKGVYKPHTSNENIAFNLKDGVKLYGGFKGDEISLSSRHISVNKTVLSGDIDNNDKHLSPAGLTTSYKHIYGLNSKTVITLNNNTDPSTRLDGLYISAGASNTNSAGGLNLDRANIQLEHVYFYGNGKVLANKGGALYANNTTISCKHCQFIENTADKGGAFYATNSTVHINYGLFSSNFANYGGAMLNKDNPTTIHITNTSFNYNVVKEYGGAISNKNSDNQINNVAFLSNHATLGGGAIYNNSSSNQINTASFRGNTTSGVRFDSGSGGAIYNESNSNPIIKNSTFAYNTSFSAHTPHDTSYGGALYNDGSYPVLINTMFYHNHADKGEAIYTHNTPSKRPLFVNSIFWHNGRNGENEYKWSSYGTNSRPLDGSGNHNHIKHLHSTDPKLIEKTQRIRGVLHTYYQVGSSLIGNGLMAGAHTISSHNINVPNTDLLGHSRTSAITKGAIQSIDTTTSPSLERPFIKTFAAHGSRPTTIKLMFSQTMNPSSFTSSAITLTNEAGQVVNFSSSSWDSNVKEFRFTAGITLYSDTESIASWHTLTVSTAIKNANGVSLNKKYVYNFKAK